MFEIELTKQAETDIQESADWYNEQKDELGNEFIEELENTIKSIQNNPNQFQKVQRKKNIRRAILNRFPFLMYFAFTDKITIFAVMHSSRNPEEFRKRMK